MITTNKKELLIGLTGDTHVPSRVPEFPKYIIEDFKEKQIDYLFHMGDFTSFKVYKNLQNTFGKEKVIALIGNMDDSELRKVLPEIIDLELFEHKIFMTHGTGGPNIIIKRLNKSHDLSKYDIIIFGHVHRPYNETWRDGKLYISPGAPTGTKFTVNKTYGYLTISKENIKAEIIYF